MLASAHAALLPGWPLETAAKRFSTEHHGDYLKWAQAVQDLPALQHVECRYTDTVTVTGHTDNDVLRQQLELLHPWRKGPFQISHTRIDTEWRSDLKWARVAAHLGDLSGAHVLDIGCGNGYFGWRMLEAGAARVTGIDPTLLFCMQHLAIQHYTGDLRNCVLPLRVEELPDTVKFDRVFSMGVIYHRRDPLAHVKQLRQLTQPGGRVILESLIVEGATDLQPPGRYARMRNVWCVPSVDTLKQWLTAAGFSAVEVLDISTTQITEQRSTPWMQFESLSNALDPDDPTLTVEGHPAPIRAVLMAYNPAT